MLEQEIEPRPRARPFELGIQSRELHFGLSPVCGPGDWWNRRGVVTPYAYLKAWQKGTQRSPVPAVTAWQQKHGCPTSPDGVADP